MATEDYVAVAGDDWYQRRRDDAEGRFFRKVADQGPRKGEGGATRQGIYCLTASGKLLYWKNAGQLPDEMRKALRWGLDNWRRLPATERQPGAVEVPDLERTDPRYTRKPPAGTLILSVSTRILDKVDGGKFCRGTCGVAGGDRVARDHAWILPSEWQALVPAGARVGSRAAMPAGIAERLVRFHLIDNTRGEPPMWEREQIRASDLTVTVEKANADRVQLRVEGRVLLATDADLAKADRGFDARVLGYLEYDYGRKVFHRWDVVAVGDHWGEGAYTRGARDGRKPLGVAFEVAKGDSAGDQVPPQAAREVQRYLGNE